MCGVNKFRRRWGQVTCPKCPCCGQNGPGQANEVEDALHVSRCHDKRVAEHWSSQLDSLSTWMTTNLTCPSIASIIIHVLWEVRRPLQPLYLDPRFRPALSSQRMIGPQGLLEGRITTKFSELQQQHLRRLRSRRSVKKWAGSLSAQLILIRHSMWLHRNEIAHSEASAQNLRLSNQTNQGIRKQFALGMQDLPKHIRPQLRQGITAVLELSLQERREWLELVSRERKATVRALSSQRRLMREFLHKHNLSD